MSHQPLVFVIVWSVVIHWGDKLRQSWNFLELFQYCLVFYSSKCRQLSTITSKKGNDFSNGIFPPNYNSTFVPSGHWNWLPYFGVDNFPHSPIEQCFSFHIYRTMKIILSILKYVNCLANNSILHSIPIMMCSFFISTLIFWVGIRSLYLRTT